MGRLDTRKCLYGELRLSDAQVLALRAAARDMLTPSAGPGWSNGEASVGSGTVLALRRRLLLDMKGDGVVASSAAIKILAAIDEDSAPSPARSAS